MASQTFLFMLSKCPATDRGHLAGVLRQMPEGAADVPAKLKNDAGPSWCAMAVSVRMSGRAYGGVWPLASFFSRHSRDCRSWPAQHDEEKV